jgi:hypothetical protein
MEPWRIAVACLLWALGCTGGKATTVAGDDSAPLTPTEETSSTPGCGEADVQLDDSVCLRDVCNICPDGACPTKAEVLAASEPCEAGGSGFDYTGSSTDAPCCFETSCVHPTEGALDRVTCPSTIESTTWWFDPATGAFRSKSVATDYGCCCDGETPAALYGEDLRACE